MTQFKGMTRQQFAEGMGRGIAQWENVIPCSCDIFPFVHCAICVDYSFNPYFHQAELSRRLRLYEKWLRENDLWVEKPPITQVLGKAQ